ncbi:hypothetical protein GGI12_000689 [Dipsacomyces acuminosporus]|nr:hypothetical protein GGI12_000689 [Dipsacomyces acuminosporus]
MLKLLLVAMDSDYFETWAGLPEPLRSLINPFNEFPPIERLCQDLLRASIYIGYSYNRTLLCIFNIPSRIVEKPENRSWIRWNEDGTELQFCDWNRLLDSLGRYGLSAKQKESVNKNFHDYGFKRLSDNRKRVPDNNGIVWCRFKHENFQRGKPDLVKNIYRRYRRPAN